MDEEEKCLAVVLEDVLVGEGPCLNVVEAQPLVLVRLLLGKGLLVRDPALGVPSVPSLKGTALLLWGQGLGASLILAELGLALDVGAAPGRRNTSEAFWVVADLNHLVLRMGLGMGLMEGVLTGGDACLPGDLVRDPPFFQRSLPQQHLHAKICNGIASFLEAVVPFLPSTPSPLVQPRHPQPWALFSLHPHVPNAPTCPLCMGSPLFYDCIAMVAIVSVDFLCIALRPSTEAVWDLFLWQLKA